ncbi:4Fe-4S dicluster domain-containing protein [Hydrogenoanaerobacterium sp.]|uniref:4Fe-4S dicluster domain-containing protein n=1 Tax=Hydrogenoanaerobacterium sp. TaxID=2953763 RepID=UPI00289B95E4|nr:4Fe-4S dicluster domain-containing protein [Hydrogenoanaerobacterium sp.]
MNLIEAVRASGIVGAGGAGFPTHVKLDTKADCFIINAAECEPLIETDKYLCRTFADKLIAAVNLVAEHLGAQRKVIALKGKYQAEIAALQAAVDKSGSIIEIFEMPTFYPAGDEQTMVHMICGKSVPERGIPIQVGAVVNNVGTLLDIYDALEGIPVTDKYLSVVGEVQQPVMLKVPIGTSVVECIEKAKPTLSSYAVILGGPMMGKVYNNKQEIDSLVVTKTTGNVIVLPMDHYLVKHDVLPMSTIRAQTRSACIQCRMCTDLCPRYLIGHRIRPHLVMRNLYREPLLTDDTQFEQAFGDAVNCCDCGICEMFACPMGLSPKKVNGYFKARLRERRIQVERNLNPVAREEIDIKRTPTGRLTARLGLAKYYDSHAKECFMLSPKTVKIPFQQHIGKPALPVKQVGDRVQKGELLAAAVDGALSANIHASIDGMILRQDAACAVIGQSEEES